MKYDKQHVKAIVKGLEVGHTRKDACILADISQETFNQWMKKPEFSEQVKKAELKAKDQSIKIIRNAALKHWTAAAWWLERKHRDEFAVKQVINHDGTLNINLGEEAAKRAVKYEDSNLQ